MLKGIRLTCLTAALAAFASAAMAQELPPEGPAPTTALVQVQIKNAAQLDPRDLSLQVDGRKAQITSVQPVASGQAEIAILIDDGLRSVFSQQLAELRDFINSLPPSAKVLVGYMQNGMVRSSGHFSSDHQELVNDLRMPMSVPGSSASPYFCLSDFVKKWPSHDHAARFVLMITNGIDPYNGRPSIMNQDSPYVQAAQDDAQRAGVAVYSIYFPNAGLFGGRGSFSGQSYLQQVGDATGGELFNNGPIPPVSIGPYLKQFSTAIGRSYEISFLAPVQQNPRALASIRLRTSQPGVKLHAPHAVRPGLVE